jgi:hypothetical protein
MWLFLYLFHIYKKRVEHWNRQVKFRCVYGSFGAFQFFCSGQKIRGTEERLERSGFWNF